VAAAIAIFIFFFAIAPAFRTLPSFSTVLYASSTIGIVAVGVALLMIGGEFDLSSGGHGGDRRAVRRPDHLPAVAEHVGRGAAVPDRRAGHRVHQRLPGRQTKIPVFLITLSTFFMLRGINLGRHQGHHRHRGHRQRLRLDGFLAAKAVFASDIPLGFITVKITVLWWLLFVAIGTWILLRTKVGNWIFAAGGNADSARAVGVPVPR
jgi:simple sugar transport system permease protein